MSRLVLGQKDSGTEEDGSKAGKRSGPGGKLQPGASCGANIPGHHCPPHSSEMGESLVKSLGSAEFPQGLSGSGGPGGGLVLRALHCFVFVFRLACPVLSLPRAPPSGDTLTFSSGGAGCDLS